MLNALEMKVFIVEDDRITQMYLEHMLLQEGHSVLGFAVAGEKAIPKIEEYKPDLILMDIELEGEMNGIDTASLIRSTSQVPIVFITGNSDRVKTDERMKEIQPLAVLIKPVMDGDLTSVLNSASLPGKAS